MNLDQVNKWLTLATNLGVIAGIVLVAIQLKQNTLITNANLAASAYQQETEYFIAMLGENPSAIVAKATLHPGELTAEDILVLQSEVGWYASMFRRNAYLESKGIFDDSWREILPSAGANLGSDPVRKSYLLSMPVGDWMKELQEHAASVPPGEGAEAIQTLLRTAKQATPGVMDHPPTESMNVH